MHIMTCKANDIATSIRAGKEVPYTAIARTAGRVARLDTTKVPRTVWPPTQATAEQIMIEMHKEKRKNRFAIARMCGIVKVSP